MVVVCNFKAKKAAYQKDKKCIYLIIPSFSYSKHVKLQNASKSVFSKTIFFDSLTKYTTLSIIKNVNY